MIAGAAEKEAVTAAPPSSLTAPELKVKDNVHYKAGDYDAAIASYLQAILKDETVAQHFGNRAAAYLQRAKARPVDLGIESKDEGEAERAVEGGHKSGAGTGSGSLKADLECCITDCGSVLNLNPQYAKAVYRRVQALELLGIDLAGALNEAKEWLGGTQKAGKPSSGGQNKATMATKAEVEDMRRLIKRLARKLERKSADSNGSLGILSI